MRIASATVALCLTCGSVLRAASGENSSGEFAKRLQAGVEEARRGEYPSARVDIEAAVRLDPKSSAGWYELGRLVGELADFRGAEEAFRRAIQITPEFAEAHFNLALTLIAQPESKLDWPAAIRELREALKNRPDYPEALNLLGAGLSATGENDAAIGELQHAIQLRPSLAEAHFNLGICFERGDKLEDALREYAMASDAKGDYPEALTASGKLLLRTGKQPDAEEALKKALRLNPDLPDAHYTLARVLQSAGRKQEAADELAVYSQLARRKTDAAESANLSNQGLQAAAKGNLSSAVTLLRQAVALKPDYGVPHHNLGLLLADTGQFGPAADQLVEATSLLPGESKPWYDLGRVLRANGDERGALDALLLAQRLAPADAAVRAELASLTPPVDSSSTRSALSPKQAAILGPPADTAAAHSAFGAALSARHNDLCAVGEYLRALTLQPARGETRRDLAAAYARLGDTAAAKAEYRKALRISSSDVAAHLGLGKLLMIAGDTPAAETQFREALQLKPADPEALAELNRSSRNRPSISKPTP